jgi:subtilisin family serine protease
MARIIMRSPWALAPLVLLLVAATGYAGDGVVHGSSKKVPNSYIVMLNRGEGADDVAADLEKRHGGKLTAVFRNLGSFSISLPNEKAAEGISHDPRVEWIEEDGVAELASCFRHLASDGSQWPLGRLNSPTADSFDPNNFYRTLGDYSAWVQVFVIDTAISTSFGDLSGKLPVTQTVSTIPGLNYGICTGGSGEPIGGPMIVGSGGFDPYHGTAVASIIAGSIYGVVPELSNFYSIQVADCQGSITGTSMQGAADWAISRHIAGRPAVANASLRIDRSHTDEARQFDSAIQRMVQNGIFVAVAAGNDSKSACDVAPAGLGGANRYPGMLSVGATNIFGSPEGYSNSGNCVDVWAPGGPTSDEAWQVPSDKLLQTGVGPKWGTSMAAPHVAGAAILIYSKYPFWSPADVGSQIKYLDAHVVSSLRLLAVPLPPVCLYCTSLDCAPIY